MYLNYNQQDRPETSQGRTYSIVREYHPQFDRQSELLFTGLTRAEAKAYCSDPRSSVKDQYFDTFIDETQRAKALEKLDKWFEAIQVVQAGPRKEGALNDY